MDSERRGQSRIFWHIELSRLGPHGGEWGELVAAIDTSTSSIYSLTKLTTSGHDVPPRIARWNTVDLVTITIGRNALTANQESTLVFLIEVKFRESEDDLALCKNCLTEYRHLLFDSTVPGACSIGADMWQGQPTQNKLIYSADSLLKGRIAGQICYSNFLGAGWEIFRRV